MAPPFLMRNLISATLITLSLLAPAAASADADNTRQDAKQTANDAKSDVKSTAHDAKVKTKATAHRASVKTKHQARRVKNTAKAKIHKATD